MKKAFLFFTGFLLIIFSCSKQVFIWNYGRITNLAGTAVIQRENKSQNVFIGDLVFKNDIIHTKDNSFCNIQFGDNVVRLKENSILEINDVLFDKMKSKEISKFKLTLGKIFVNAKKTSADYQFQINTPTTVVGVRGTEFLVENNNDKTRVYTKSGTVSVQLNLKEYPTTTVGEELDEISPMVQVTPDEEVIINKNQYETAVNKLKEKITQPDLSQNEKSNIKEKLNPVIVKTKLKKQNPELQKEFDSLVKVNEALNKKKTGILHIKSIPENAGVFINNQFAGSTPLSKVLTTKKKHHISIIHPQYNEKSIDIKLKPATTKEIILDLTRTTDKPEGEDTHIPQIKSWVINKNIRVKGDSALINGVLYFAEENGNIKAYKKAKKLWEVPTKNLINTSLLYYKKKIFIGGNDENLRCINVQNGNILWQKKLGTLLYSKPVISGNRLFIGTAGGTFYSLNPDKGTVLWEYKAGSGIFVTPAIDSSSVYFCTENNRALKLNKKTGQLIWQKDTGSKVVASSPVIYNNKLYFGNYKGGVLCLNKKNGSIKWKKYLSGRILATVSIKDDILVTGTLNGYLYALQTSNGKIIWKKQMNSGILCRSIIIDNMIYTGLKNGSIYKLKLLSGEIHSKTKVSGSVNSLFFSGGRILASTDNGIFDIR